MALYIEGFRRIHDLNIIVERPSPPTSLPYAQKQDEQSFTSRKSRPEVDLATANTTTATSTHARHASNMDGRLPGLADSQPD
jgi:hypothetical protein